MNDDDFELPLDIDWGDDIRKLIEEIKRQERNKEQIDRIHESLDWHLEKIRIKCECGAEKAKTTHSDWCPKYKIV